MHRFIYPALAALLYAGTTAHALANSDAAAAISQAEKDLALAKEKDGVWMIIDKATGKTAVPLPKMLEAARKAAESGNAAEAARIAEKVSTFARLGIAQMEGQPDPKPLFPE